MTRADGLSRLNVERRKERGHSMAQVVVRLPLGHARAHWKDRLRTVQRRRGLDRCRVAGAEPRRRQPSQRSRARGLPARRQGADGFWRFSSPQGRALRGRDRARVRGRAWRRPRLQGPLPPQSALGCIRHEDRARCTLFARRARTLRRPQRTGTEEEPADRNRSQRRDLRSSAALAYVAVADWRIGTYEAWSGAVADRGGQIAADVGAESPRGPLKANEVGHIVKSVARWAWERYGADVPPLPTRSPDRGAARARESPPEGPGSRPGAFADEPR